MIPGRGNAGSKYKSHVPQINQELKFSPDYYKSFSLESQTILWYEEESTKDSMVKVCPSFPFITSFCKDKHDLAENFKTKY